MSSESFDGRDNTFGGGPAHLRERSVVVVDSLLTGREEDTTGPSPLVSASCLDGERGVSTRVATPRSENR
jgi:hypothetical protein